jgi:hypothetical protein
MSKMTRWEGAMKNFAMSMVVAFAIFIVPQDTYGQGVPKEADLRGVLEDIQKKVDFIAAQNNHLSKILSEITSVHQKLVEINDWEYKSHGHLQNLVRYKGGPILLDLQKNLPYPSVEKNYCSSPNIVVCTRDLAQKICGAIGYTSSIPLRISGGSLGSGDGWIDTLLCYNTTP